MIEIANILRRAREEKGLSQRALAAKLGVAQNQITKMESGKVDIRLSSLSDAARALDLEVMLIPKAKEKAVETLLRAQDSGSIKPAYDLDRVFEGNGAGEGAGAGSDDGSGWG